MSLLRPDEGPLHHGDGSHRWLCADPTGSQEAWVERVRIHLDDHRANPNDGYMRARSGAIVGRPLPRTAFPPQRPAPA